MLQSVDCVIVPRVARGVSLELREVVYCTAIAHGGAAEWNFAWSQYSISNDQKYKHMLLRVMGCGRDPDQEEG